MPKLVVINVTDDSIGVENKPDDWTIEIRDYRTWSLDHPTSMTERDQDGRHYVQHRFEAEL